MNYLCCLIEEKRDIAIKKKEIWLTKKWSIVDKKKYINNSPYNIFSLEVH